MKKLLYIAHRMPYPPDKGERVRAFNEICALMKSFEVTVIAGCAGQDDHASAKKLADYCAGVEIFPIARHGALFRGACSFLMGKSVSEGYFSSYIAGRKIKRLGRFDVAVGYSSSVLSLLLQADAGRRVMDIVDADSAKWADYARKTPGPMKKIFEIESRRVARLEKKCVELCDDVVLVSGEEAAILGDKIPNLHVVANGVDADFFSPSLVSPVTELGEQAIVFTGSMDYRPNAEAVEWFANEVFPEVRKKFPAAVFAIVGRNPTKMVCDLAMLDGVKVTGNVVDVRPYIQAAAVSVCPLHIGRGIQNKVLEAMAMSRAVVVSPQAMSGLDVTAGIDVELAETSGQWVEKMLYLLAEDERRTELGRAARQCVLEKYSWQARLKDFVSLCLKEVE
jgi:sugar transferase (PEP-CTERM/EpsH1 system associated)